MYKHRHECCSSVASIRVRACVRVTTESACIRFTTSTVFEEQGKKSSEGQFDVASFSQNARSGEKATVTVTALQDVLSASGVP